MDNIDSWTRGRANVGAAQILPHTFDVEGFFVSCFRKGGAASLDRGGRSDGISTPRCQLLDRFKLTLLNEEQSQHIHDFMFEELGFEMLDRQKRLAEDEDTGEIWMLHQLCPELAVLGSVAQQPGIRLAVRETGSNKLMISDDLLLIAGHRAEKAKEMSYQDWAALRSAKEAGGKGAPSRWQRMARNNAIKAATQKDRWQSRQSLVHSH